MIIDDSIVLKYLGGTDEGQINSHWVFRSLEEGRYLFEAPGAKKTGSCCEDAFCF